MLINRILINTY